MATASDRPRVPAVTRFEAGVVLLALGGIALLISLFFDWYEPGRSAWQVFEMWDLVLAAVGIAALWAAAGRVGWTHPLSPRWLVIPGVSALVIVGESLLNHPPAAIGYAPMAGIWLALAASVLMIVGGAMSIARVSVAIEISDGADRRDAAPGAWPEALRSRFRRRGHIANSASARSRDDDSSLGTRARHAPRSAPVQRDRTTEVTRALGDDPDASAPPD